MSSAAARPQQHVQGDQGAPQRLGRVHHRAAMSCGPVLSELWQKLLPTTMLLYLSLILIGVKGDGDGKPADLMLSGVPSNCNGGLLNGPWDYQANTADGKRYYKKRDSERYGVWYIYYDRDVDGGGNPSRCGPSVNQWIITPNAPSLTALQDLDGDGSCLSYGWTVNPDTSGSPTPFHNSEWGVYCPGPNPRVTLSLQPICTSPPAYTYTYPEQWTPVTDGCGTGIARQRTEVESCSARGGCDCNNKRAPETEEEEQAACTATAGNPADLMLSGMPSNCFGGSSNGVWYYQADTADGKGYYKRNPGEGYFVEYLFYDKDTSGGDSSQCSSSVNIWIIDNDEPSTTALQDLDGDGDCAGLGDDQMSAAGFTVNQDTSGSPTPPISAQWKVTCGTAIRTVTLSFQPVCATIPPDYTYTYPEEWTAVKTGCGDGVARRRTEVESCSARGGCDCTNKRAPVTQTKNQDSCCSAESGAVATFVDEPDGTCLGNQQDGWRQFTCAYAADYCSSSNWGAEARRCCPATCTRVAGGAAAATPQTLGNGPFCVCPSSTPACTRNGCTKGTDTSGGEATYWTAGKCSNCKCSACPTANYQYSWSDWKPAVDGVTCGGTDYRDPIETCDALHACSCSNRQNKRRENRQQPDCTCSDYNGNCIDAAQFECNGGFVDSVVCPTSGDKCCAGTAIRTTATTTLITGTSTTKTSTTATTTITIEKATTTTTTTSTTTTYTGTTPIRGTTTTSMPTTTYTAIATIPPSELAPSGPSPSPNTAGNGGEGAGNASLSPSDNTGGEDGGGNSTTPRSPDNTTGASPPPPPPPPLADQSGKQGEPLSAGMLAGITIITLLVLAVIIVAAVMARQRETPQAPLALALAEAEGAAEAALPPGDVELGADASPATAVVSTTVNPAFSLAGTPEPNDYLAPSSIQMAEYDEAKGKNIDYLAPSSMQMSEYDEAKAKNIDCLQHAANGSTIEYALPVDTLKKPAGNGSTVEYALPVDTLKKPAGNGSTVVYAMPIDTLKKKPGNKLGGSTISTTVSTTHRCAYRQTSPGGLRCLSEAEGQDGLWCGPHRCETPGCNESKSSRATYCTRCTKQQGNGGGGGGGGGRGKGLRKKGKQQQASIYLGFEGQDNEESML